MKKIGRIMIIISLALVIFGTTCLFLAKRENEKNRIYYVRNVYGDNIEVTIYNDELVYAKWGTPLKYCDKCHGIMNGEGTYGWYELEICRNCWKDLSEKYHAEHNS